MTAAFAGARGARPASDGSLRIRSRAVRVFAVGCSLLGGTGLVAVVVAVVAGTGAAAGTGVTPLLLLAFGLGLARCHVRVTDDEVTVVNVTGTRRIHRQEVVGVDTAATGSVALRVRLHLRDGTIVPMTATSAVPRSGARISPRSAGRDLEAAFLSWAGAPGTVTGTGSSEGPRASGMPTAPPPGGTGTTPPDVPTAATAEVPGVADLGGDRVLVRFGTLRLLAVVVVIVGVLPGIGRILAAPEVFALHPVGGPVVVVMLALAIGAWRSRVEVTPDEVVTVNLWRTHRIARAEVGSVTWAKTSLRGNVIRLGRSGGGSVALLATLSLTRTVQGHTSPQAHLEAALRLWRDTGRGGAVG